MFHSLYEDVVKFASEGDLREELKTARAEYEQRTGQLLESDIDFERRIAAFLEWYVLDRPLAAIGVPPVVLYLNSHSDRLGPEKEKAAEALRASLVSLFEYGGARGEQLRLKDVLSGNKHVVVERRKPAGVESGDIMEARLVPVDDTLQVFDTWAVHPRQARKTILKAAKTLRKSKVQEDPQKRLDWVHRVAYLSNRCMRYKHVDPAVIFADLNKAS